MITLNRAAKIGVIACLLSLIIYDSYILRGSFAILFGYFANVPQDVGYVRMTGPVFWFGLVGLVGRFVECILGLAATYLLWVKARPFGIVRVLVASALFLEGLYYLSYVPSVWFLLRPGFAFSLSLGMGYILQIALTTPLLWVLAAKVATYPKNSRDAILRYGAVAFVGYIAALAVNQISRWSSMISADSLQFLLQDIRLLGFLDAVVLMPLAIILAVVAAVRLMQRKANSALWWFGSSLSVVGLNYVLYVLYSYFVNSLNSLPLVDVWTVPLLGLGLALMINTKRSIGTQT